MPYYSDIGKPGPIVIVGTRFDPVTGAVIGPIYAYTQGDSPLDLARLPPLP
jgi:hypothetical protein